MTFANIANYIYKRLRAVDMTLEAIAALLAQIQKESLFIVNNVENGRGWTDEGYTMAVDSGSYKDFAVDEIGYGLYQLTEKSRKKAYWDLIIKRGCSIADLEAQVDYLLSEMQHSFPGIWRMMLTSHDLYFCTKQLLYKWENPQEKEENLKERYTYAEKWFDILKAYEATEQPASNSTESSAIGKVLALAKSEIGYHEKASNSLLDEKTANTGSGNFTKYGRDLDAVPSFYNGKKNGYAWCDQFVDWLFFKCFGAELAMQMLCQPQNSAGAGCMYSAQYYKSAGRWVRDPQPGDQAFFYDNAGQINHTGIVETVTDTAVSIIEGNCTDRVLRQSYTLDSGYIAGYGRPKWELVNNQNESPVITIVPENVLKLGSKGIAVQEMQKCLIELGYDVGKDGADGDFGWNTLEALKKFQIEHNIASEFGYCGEKTYYALTDKKTDEPTLDTVNTKTDFHVGDFVEFIGDKQFLTPYTKNPKAALPGKARIVTIRNNSDHPYYLAHAANGGSDVQGWVNAEDMRDFA